MATVSYFFAIFSATVEINPTIEGFSEWSAWRHKVNPPGYNRVVCTDTDTRTHTYTHARRHTSTQNTVVRNLLIETLRPVYTGDFCCDLKRDFACKLLAIQVAAESPVVYTGDLKSPQNRTWNRSKNRQCKRYCLDNKTTNSVLRSVRSIIGLPTSILSYSKVNQSRMWEM